MLPLATVASPGGGRGEQRRWARAKGHQPVRRPPLSGPAAATATGRRHVKMRARLFTATATGHALFRPRAARRKLLFGVGRL